MSNWLIGYYIVEYEQHGEDRAQYGTHLLEEMAKNIKARGIKGLDVRSLRSCRTFYNTYPQLSFTHFVELIRFETLLDLASVEAKAKLWQNMPLPEWITSYLFPNI